MKYRKRPLVIDAIQFTGDNVRDIWEAFGTAGIYGPTEANPDHLILTTAHGDPAPARPGDWVVPDSQPATFYPIKPDVFERTYEPETCWCGMPEGDHDGAAHDARAADLP